MNMCIYTQDCWLKEFCSLVIGRLLRKKEGESEFLMYCMHREGRWVNGDKFGIYNLGSTKVHKKCELFGNHSNNNEKNRKVHLETPPVQHVQMRLKVILKPGK